MNAPVVVSISQIAVFSLVVIPMCVRVRPVVVLEWEDATLL